MLIAKTSILRGRLDPAQEMFARSYESRSGVSENIPSRDVVATELLASRGRDTAADRDGRVASLRRRDGRHHPLGLGEGRAPDRRVDATAAGFRRRACLHLRRGAVL